MRIGWLTVLFCVIGFGMVCGRLLYMQVIKKSYYSEKATTLQTRDEIVTPNRGRIYDTNMQVLAESATVEKVTISPKGVIDEELVKNGVSAEEQQKKLARVLADNLELDYDTVLKQVQKTNSSYEIIAKKVDNDTMAKLTKALTEEKCDRGVYPAPDTRRYYPYGSYLSAVLGYTNSDNVGAYGLEAQYESELAGTAGRIVRAQNAKNQDMPYQYEQETPATDGNSLVLTIDSDIQSYLEKHLETALTDNPEARGGVSGIVMDVKTGAILAMASLPDFDPNKPYVITNEKYINELKTSVQAALDEFKVSADISDKYYREGGLENLPEVVQKNEELINRLTELRSEQLYKMWYNPVVTDNYEPGSTFKLMNVATAYELGLVHDNDTFFCGGSMMVGDWKKPIKCWKTEGHGMLTLTETLVNSCNVGMMRIVAKTGLERFYDFYKAFGLTRTTGIDLPMESNGQFHDVNSSAWNEVSLATASFGQRFTVTPIQMVSMIAAIVDDGKLKKPYVVREILDSDGTVKSTINSTVVRQVISADTSAFMRQAMEAVVDGGTGKNAYVAGYRVGGKTATSEIQKKNDKDGKVIDTEDRYTASFIGVAPMDDPQIVVLVAIQDLPESVTHGGGAIAAPVVGRVMEDVLPYLGVTAGYSEAESDRREIAVPSVIGMSPTDAEKTMKDAGFTCKIEGDGQKVTDQVPAGGIKIPMGGEIILYMGGYKPTEQIEVPNVLGLTPSQCHDTLAEQGLYLKQKGVATSQVTEQTTATRQNPVAGTKVNIGAVITVEYSNSDDVDDR